MNLHTHMVKTLKKETKTDHHAEIVTKVESILQTIEVLMEDPLFIDGIHGEQELSLDLAVDLFTNIKAGFIPLSQAPKMTVAHEAGTIDVS